jgi:hypothetical protein
VDLIVVDTSALVAILFREADADRLGRALADAPIRMVSAVTRVELSCVVEGRKGEAGRTNVDLLFRDGSFEIVGVTPRVRPRSPSMPFAVWQGPASRITQYRRLLFLCIGRRCGSSAARQRQRFRPYGYTASAAGNLNILPGKRCECPAQVPDPREERLDGRGNRVAEWFSAVG